MTIICLFCHKCLFFFYIFPADPVMYLLLPVLLPMFIIVCIIRGLGQQYHPGSGGGMVVGSGGPGSSLLAPSSSSSPSSSGNSGSALSTTAASVTDGEDLVMSSSYPTASLVGNPDYSFATSEAAATTAYNHSINSNIGAPSANIPKKNKKHD